MDDSNSLRYEICSLHFPRSAITYRGTQVFLAKDAIPTIFSKENERSVDNTDEMTDVDMLPIDESNVAETFAAPGISEAEGICDNANW